MITLTKGWLRRKLQHYYIVPISAEVELTEISLTGEIHDIIKIEGEIGAI